jgi:hypothetical protein
VLAGLIGPNGAADALVVKVPIVSAALIAATANTRLISISLGYGKANPHEQNSCQIGVAVDAQ